jgi:low temperature requirement protein LtrA
MLVMLVWIGASIFVADDIRIWMWGGFVLVFIAGMVIFAFSIRDSDDGSQAAGPLATDSLLERFALFLIIVLGEVVASVVAGLGEVIDLTSWIFLTGFAGLAVAIAFWWTYFDLIGMRAPRPTVQARYLYNLAQLPLCLALTGVGAATVSLIEHGSEGSTPESSAWLFGGFVALAMATAAWAMRLLDDYQRLSSVYRPAVRASLLIAALALILAAWQPPPLLFALTLVAAMCIQWTFAVYRWLDTPDGLAKIAELHIDEA